MLPDIATAAKCTEEKQTTQVTWCVRTQKTVNWVTWTLKPWKIIGIQEVQKRCAEGKHFGL